MPSGRTGESAASLLRLPTSVEGRTSMEQKPGDLLLGVIEFFGILIPGAALVFLHGNLLLSPLGLSMTSLQTPADWIPAFIVSYILGHFLFALGIPLNPLAARFL